MMLKLDTLEAQWGLAGSPHDLNWDVMAAAFTAEGQVLVACNMLRETPPSNYPFLQSNDEWDECVRVISETIARAHVETPVSPQKHFAKKVFSIPGVKAVHFYQLDDQAIHLWTVVGPDDFDLRASVYQVEAEMYALFPNTLFDFYVVTEERLPKGKTPREVIPPVFSIVSK